MVSILSRFSKLTARVNIVGLGLRGTSMVSKFLLVMVLTKFATLEDLGVYGIFVSSVLLLNYIQGLEFHAYTSRQLLGGSDHLPSKLIGNQLIVHTVTYAVVFPFALTLFWGQFLSWDYINLFFSVLVLTHLGQEAHRLLIVLSRPNSAFFIAFIIHGSWALVACILFYICPSTTNLNTIFQLWASSAAVGVAIAVIFLASHKCFDRTMFDLDLAWIRNGLKVSFKLLLGVIAFKTVEVSDRFFIQHYHGKAEVGVYTLFSSVSNIVLEVVATGVVVLIFPMLVSSYNKGESVAFKMHLRRLEKGVLFASAAAAALALIAMYAIISYVDNSVLVDDLPVFGVLLTSSVILSISLIPHYVLYAQSKDREIMWTAIAAAILNTILNFTLILELGNFGAALSTLASVLLILIAKYWFIKNVTGVEKV